MSWSLGGLIWCFVDALSMLCQWLVIKLEPMTKLHSGNPTHSSVGLWWSLQYNQISKKMFQCRKGWCITPSDMSYAIFLPLTCARQILQPDTSWWPQFGSPWKTVPLGRSQFFALNWQENWWERGLTAISKPQSLEDVDAWWHTYVGLMGHLRTCQMFTKSTAMDKR